MRFAGESACATGGAGAFACRIRLWGSTLQLLCLGLAALVPPSAAQPLEPKLYSGMRWRTIGPTRAGRARAVAGSPSQPNVAYIGFDNGGVWRSTDYGSTWAPIFDGESTGSIGAIAVAPSAPNTIYVGTGAGIIRPDLATGDGMYKSTDAGKTWAHLGLRDSQMIANIEVDPADPNRLFVAALGHPYGPNPERGIFRASIPRPPTLSTRLCGSSNRVSWRTGRLPAPVEASSNPPTAAIPGSR